jgi:hypothetical protein
MPSLIPPLGLLSLLGVLAPADPRQRRRAHDVRSQSALVCSRCRSACVEEQRSSWTLTIGGGYGPTKAPRGSYGARPGVFQLWTPCGPVPENTVNLDRAPAQATPGKHSVWVRARVPGSEPKYVESERVDVLLACDEPKPLPPQSPPDLVTPVPKPETAETRTEQHAVAESDSSDDSSDDAEEITPARENDDGGGCSLRRSVPGNSSGAWLLVALGLTVLWGRGRARERPGSPQLSRAQR